MMHRKRKIIVAPTKQDGGFTIVESLLAIIIVGILLVGIAPVMVISVATRIQAKRVESATQAARTYIEGTRATSIQAPNSRVFMKPTAEGTLKNTITDGVLFDGAVEPPPVDALSGCLTQTAAKANTNCKTNSYVINDLLDSTKPSLYCFDVDGDGVCSVDSLQDMIVQSFRSTTIEDTSSTVLDAEQGYILGIRVYRADGFDGSAPLKASNSTDSQRAATFAGGLGDKKAPIVEITTDITIRGSDITKLFPNICTRLGNAPSRGGVPGGTSCGVAPSPSP
jgi:prepilin-type N-terminal cleavage/methylation domain-containing protein